MPKDQRTESTPLLIVCWGFSAKDGKPRFGFIDKGGATPTLFSSGRLVVNSDLTSDVLAALDIDNEEGRAAIIQTEFLGPWSSVGWLARTNYAYCQVNIMMPLKLEHVSRLGQMTFLTLEQVLSETGASYMGTINTALLGELKLIEMHPPTME